MAMMNLNVGQAGKRVIFLANEYVQMGNCGHKHSNIDQNETKQTNRKRPNYIGSSERRPQKTSQTCFSSVISLHVFHLVLVR